MRRPPFFLLFQTRPDGYSTKGLVAFVIVYFGAFAVAAVVGPFAHALVLTLAESRGAEEGLLAYLAGKGMGVYIDRVRLFVALLATLWLINYCGLWGRFGFQFAQGTGASVMRWFGLGCGMLLFVAGLQVVFGDASLVPGLGLRRVFSVVAMALTGALVLSFFEEALFRGMLLRLFFTAMRPWPAVLLSAAVFAAVHFKRVPYDPALAEVWWGGGWVALKMAFAFIFQFQALPFLNLFLAGVLLNLLFLRSGSLWVCVALHAGWVLVRNAYTKLFDYPSGASGSFLGSESIVDGYLSLVILLGLVLFLSYAQQHRIYQASHGRDP